MSHFRLARISLMLAALGLNAAPALITGAYAQDKPAAAPADTVRPDMYKLLDPAKIDALMAAKKFDVIQANLVAAEALPNPTPYESYAISRTRLTLGVTSNNDALTIPALEALVAGGRLAKKELTTFITALGDHYYNKKDYSKAIEWYKRYQKESDTPEKVRQKMSRAYFWSKDDANARIELNRLITAAEAAGTAPDFDDLTMRANAEFNQKDKVAYAATLEKLVTYYPKDEYWADLLHRLPSKPGFRPTLQLDLYRLQVTAQKALAADEYVDMAELALQGAFFTEAKAALDAGYANGVLGKGADAAKQNKLRDQANKGAADDAKNIAADDAKVRASKNGQGMTNLGYTYVTMNQFDKGIELIEKGIAKGGMKNPDDAKLRLAVAYVKAGKKDEALKIFDTLKGNDGMSDLARYWTIFLKAPAAPAAAK